MINEIFPDPGEGLSDADDEFVELYNPNSGAVLLDGFSLWFGQNLSRNIALSGIISGNSYLVFNSADTSLSLSNTGGKAQLIDAAGNVYGDTVIYGPAKQNLSYARDESGKWLWTKRPTPDQKNEFIPIEDAKAAPAAAKTNPKQAAKATSTSKTTQTPSPKSSQSKVLANSNDDLKADLQP